MSYINMDHAGWVEHQIAASKRTKPTAKERRMLGERRGWHAAPDTLNAFQRRAFDILGIVGGGIYNAPISWDGLSWGPRGIWMAWRKSLGTFDFNELTTFVLLCHEARIRGHIGPLSHHYLVVSLHERVATGPMSVRHPDIDEMLLSWRSIFPSGHSIVYSPTTEQVADSLAESPGTDQPTAP